METKSFPIQHVLSTVTGRLMGDIGGVYNVLNWMTGESVYTHQLPRISQEATPVIVAMHPTLQQAIDDADQVTPDNFKAWLQTWTDRYGDMMAVPKMNADQHEIIDPISELAERFHPDRFIVVTIPQPDSN